MRMDAIRSAVAPLLALALLVSCGRGTSTEPEVGVVGSYALVQVEGQPLPFAFTDTELLRGEIVDGALTLNADRRYQWAITVRWTLGTTPDTTQVFARSGTFQQTGTEIRLNTEAGLTSSGTADGTTVVVQAELEDVPNTVTYTFARDGGS
jgi:hypothetical protein